jgi:hypothetical protein
MFHFILVDHYRPIYIYNLCPICMGLENPTFGSMAREPYSGCAVYIVIGLDYYTASKKRHTPPIEKRMEGRQCTPFCFKLLFRFDFCS